MALTFPLTLAQFWSLLPIASCVFDLPETVASSRTRGGELLQAETGTRLWTAEVRLGEMTRAEAAQVLPLIHLLRGAGRSFMASDPLRAFPQADPAGTTLGTATVQIASLASNARDLTLKGLPSGYVLRRDDMLAFAYAASPTRFALHQVVSGSVTAASTGVTPTIEVVPPIRPGAAVDAAVTLKRPSLKAQIVPDSVQPGQVRSGGMVEGVSFRLQQTLR